VHAESHHRWCSSRAHPLVVAKPVVVRSQLIAQLAPSVRYDEHIHDAFIAGVEPNDQRDAISLASNGVKKPTNWPSRRGEHRHT
jgi:hypothetical protein